MSASPSVLTEEKIREVLRVSTPVLLTDAKLMQAAVLVPILRAPGGLRTLLTVRTSRVEHHKGEVSFPGGVPDPEDRTLVDTALREASEEMGIRPSDVHVAGQLSHQRTGAGFVITPFVGFLPWPYVYKPNPDEVAEVLELPLTDVWDVCWQGPRLVLMGERQVMGYEYYHSGYRVWGATARILTNLAGLLGAPVTS